MVDVAALPMAGAAEGASKPVPVLELEIDGSSVWIGRGADVGMITSIIRALKGNR